MSGSSSRPGPIPISRRSSPASARPAANWNSTTSWCWKHSPAGAELDRWTAADCLQIAEAAAADRLVSLRERGYLVPSGRGRGTRYRLAGRLARLGRRPEAGADAAMREQILELLSARGAITNTDVRRLTGASRVRALQLLQGLVADGLLRMTGNRGGARYVAGPRPG